MGTTEVPYLLLSWMTICDDQKNAFLAIEIYLPTYINLGKHILLLSFHKLFFWVRSNVIRR